MQLTNTKNKIIYHAIVLFGTYGYQNVSMRQIASAVGIKAGSIYNHFESKDEILDAAIATYWDIFSAYHPSFDDLKQMAYTHTAREVIEKFCFIYKPEDVVIMLHLLRIQFSEQFKNDKIRNLVFETFLDGRIQDMTGLLEHLAGLGKIPDRNPAALAQMWTSTLSIAAMRAAHSISTPQEDLESFSGITGFMIDLICGEETEPQG